MRDYWIPPTKREVVEWLHAYYGGRYSRSFFRAKGRGECYAIFFKLRDQNQPVGGLKPQAV